MEPFILIASKILQLDAFHAALDMHGFNANPEMIRVFKGHNRCLNNDLVVHPDRVPSSQVLGTSHPGQWEVCHMTCDRISPRHSPVPPYPAFIDQLPFARLSTRLGGELHLLPTLVRVSFPYGLATLLGWVVAANTVPGKQQRVQYVFIARGQSLECHHSEQWLFCRVSSRPRIILQNMTVD